MQTQRNHPTQPDASMFTLWREVSELGLSTRDIVCEMLDDNRDFEVDDYRFIHKNDIDQIQRDELESDLYMLGCFNANFLSGILGAPIEAIEKMQESEAFEGIGQWIISSGNLDVLQESYASLDGYGHHFAHYDGNEQEIGDYYVFRTN